MAFETKKKGDTASIREEVEAAFSWLSYFEEGMKDVAEAYESGSKDFDKAREANSERSCNLPAPGFANMTPFDRYFKTFREVMLKPEGSSGDGRVTAHIVSGEQSAGYRPPRVLPTVLDFLHARARGFQGEASSKGDFTAVVRMIEFRLRHAIQTRESGKIQSAQDNGLVAPEMIAALNRSDLRFFSAELDALAENINREQSPGPGRVRDDLSLVMNRIEILKGAINAVSEYREKL
ncbi:MAG TPA: hypothetical protein VJH71_02140 [Candidatus Paceibacterota bacterium]